MNNYILDKKTNLASIVIPVGSTNNVTVNSQFQVTPFGTTQPYISTAAGGIVNIGSASNTNTVNINNTTTNVKFKQLVDNNTNYTMNVNDYAVEVVSSTYTTITLPSSGDDGGRMYVISTSSGNPNLIVIPQSGETIDGGNFIQLKRKYDHIQIMSNGIADWYVL
jgi:hypothetical protein